MTGGEVRLRRGEARYLPALLPPAPRARRGVVLGLPGDFEVFLDPVEEVMEAAGLEIRRKRGELSIPPQEYRSFGYEVRREIAGTAPFVLAPLLAGTDLKLREGKGSIRDELFLKVLERFGVRRSRRGRGLRLWVQRLRGTRVDLSWGPELLPFIATLACMAEGRSLIHGAGEARNMKSDRISATARGLRKLGARVLEQSGGLVVQGPAELRGGEVDGHGDYAVTAALAVAALFARGRVVIKNGPEALKAAYPRFLMRFREIGAEVGYGA
jgi:3-phosphoshikimate 1-carboxyvinyltransferase